MALGNEKFPCWDGADISRGSKGAGKRMARTFEEDGNRCRDCGFEHDSMMEVCGAGGKGLVTVCPLCHAARHVFKAGESGEYSLLLLDKPEDQPSFNRRVLELFRDGRVDEAVAMVRDLPVVSDIGSYGLMELGGILDEGKTVPDSEKLIAVPIFQKVKILKSFAEKARTGLPDQFPEDPSGRYMFPDLKGELPEREEVSSGEGIFSKKMLFFFIAVLLGGMLVWSMLDSKMEIPASDALAAAIRDDVDQGNERNVYEVVSATFSDMAFDGGDVVGKMKLSVKFHVDKGFLESGKISWMPVMAGRLSKECGSFRKGGVCVMSKDVRFVRRATADGDLVWKYIGS